MRSGLRHLSERYFQVMSIPLLAGRGFTPDDARPRDSIAFIVNQAFVRKHWGSPRETVGKRVTIPNPMGYPAAAAEIVGVVADSLEMGAARTAQPRIYSLFWRSNFSERMTVLVKSRGDAAAVAGSLSEAVRELDEEQPTGEVLSLETVVSARYARQRLVLS